MILKWTAAWYELDQTIIVGDKDWFYLPSDENNHFFFNELYQSNSFIRKKLEIERITHPVLGNVKGIVTIGLDYTIYLTDGTMLEVNAEENPGQIYNSSLAIDDWTFDVEVRILDEACAVCKKRCAVFIAGDRKPNGVFRHCMGLYPTKPSKPSPGICSTCSIGRRSRPAA